MKETLIISASWITSTRKLIAALTEIIYSVVLNVSWCRGPVRDDTFLETTSSDSVCTVKNTSYSRGEEIPNVAPCETCICEPPHINCSIIRCQPNNGCKIIQQPNKCCPEYKCDCEYGGKTYNNGEKLENPSNPCQVCYCRGGEIMCNSITCYRRDDCEPQHVEGQCCPKYGHCPTKNSSSIIAVPGDPSSLSTKREMQPWLLTKPMIIQTTETHKYPQTIKIVEILPTQNPAKTGEVSLVPRIITNGSPQEFKMTSSPQPVTESCEEGCNPSEAAETSGVMSQTENGESGEPDSETITKLWSSGVDTTTSYDEQAALSNSVTEGSGFEILTGGTYLPGVTKVDEESSEESSEEDFRNSTNDVTKKGFPKNEFVEYGGTESSDKKADLKEDITEPITESSDVVTDSSPTTLLPSTPTFSETVANGEIMVTRHGLTIPPILKLNQVDHLTLPRAEDEPESRSIVQIGVYDPTNPDELSNLVTVIKNEERTMGSTVSSMEGETTQLLLTPEDLKTLAEIIIKEKIKPSKEQLRMQDGSTTPIPLEISEPTSPVSPTSKGASNNEIPENTNEESTTPHSKHESSSSDAQLHTLTKEEEKSQKIDNELADSTTNPSVGDITEMSTTSAILLENKDVEWVGETNSTSQPEVIDNDVEKTTSMSSEVTTTENSKYAEAEINHLSTTKDSTTGSHRQIETLATQSHPKRPSTDAQFQTKSDALQSKPTHSSMLDENDRLIVANFFRKALNLH